MVDRMDQAVGRVIAALKQTGELNNTVIFFLSDNGAESRDVPIPGAPKDDPATMGSATTYVNYGAGWAQAATAPSWRFKTFATEGGIRTPAFVAGPIVRKHGSIGRVYTHVADIVPTILDIAGVPVEPGRFDGRGVQPIDGLSWTTFLRNGAPTYPPGKAVGSELFGSRSLRQGDWKIVDIGDKRWRLFNLAADPGEIRDFSEQEPARKAVLLEAWDKYAKSVGVVLPDPPLQPNPPKERE
jgi:arylsulfatase